MSSLPRILNEIKLPAVVNPFISITEPKASTKAPLAGVLSEGLEHKLTVLGKARKEGLRVAQELHGLGNLHASRRARKMATCGAEILLRHYYERDVARLKSAQFCHERLLCAFCAHGYSARMAQSYMDRVVFVLSNERLVPFMLTLTSRDSDDLAGMLDVQAAAVSNRFAAVRRARSGSRNKTEWTKFKGGVLKWEIKRGARSGKWHAHVHGVVLSSPDRGGWVDLPELRREWAELFDQDTASVRYEELHGFREFQAGDSTSLLTSLVEVFKYMVKMHGLPGADVWEAFRTITGRREVMRRGKLEVVQGRRLVRSWGVLRGVKVPEEWTDDMLQDEAFVDLWFRYLDGQSGYVPKRERPGAELGHGVGSSCRNVPGVSEVTPRAMCSAGGRSERREGSEVCSFPEQGRSLGKVAVVPEGS